MELPHEDNILLLSGALDLRRTSEVRTAIYALLAGSAGDVIVDVADVGTVDLTALRMLAVANRVAEQSGRRVILRGCSPGVRRLLHLSHLRPMIPVEPDSTTRV